MLKYPVKGKIVTVQGEEEYMVSHLNSFRYIEMDGEFIETPCQNFEEVPQILASTETATNRPPLKMASLKDARAMVEEDGCTNWGQLPDFTHKIDNLVWALLQGIKRLLGALGMEDFPYISTIGELMQLEAVKRIQTSTTESTQQPMVDRIN